MAMSGGGSSSSTGLTNDINITPMIDILLVLLVIFMMAVPMMRKAIDVQIPDPNPPQNVSQQQSDQIVLQVLPGNQYKINSLEVPAAGLLAKLKEIYDPRPDKVIFVKGDPTVKYQDVIHAMDIARGAGVKVIGVPPKS